MAQSKPVILELNPPIAQIQLNRPQVHHAINEEMMDLLDAYTAEVADHPEIRVGILTATGQKTFCAGGDLKFFSTLTTRESGLALSRRMQSILNRIWKGDKPYIVAINGDAFGGGCEIVTACHLRIAADHARFSYRQAANGLITGWGGGVRLFQLLGPAALRLLVTAEQISATEAVQLGLVDQVVPGDRLLAVAEELAHQIASNAPGALAAFLEVFRAAVDGQWTTARAIETNRFADLWIGDAFRQFLDRFLNTAPPQSNREASTRSGK
ncbi:MAG: enoyl-CoA hydratase/isomerase family protein [Calditrichaeota bacterium]|nr:enoyl-CoA hydratase/isomerase family protein [Calditrichota bacterium]